MLIIPAIDLKEGAAVRLKQGQFDKITVFADEPLMLAEKYAKSGALRLHLVDLDGAQSGQISQLDLLTEIIRLLKNYPITIQVGGGIRSLESLNACIKSGINNIVLGSLAVSNKELALAMIEQIGAKNIVLALDVNEGQGDFKAATHGWQKESSESLWDLVRFYEKAGVNHILCTDIALDGMMQGPNFKLYEEAILRFPNLCWQASGGIRNMADLKKLAKMGLNAAILGRTLYESDFDLNRSQQELLTC